MGVQNRAHIEELQRYCRERDDLVNDLESKIRSQEDATKIYKKVRQDSLTDYEICFSLSLIYIFEIFKGCLCLIADLIGQCDEGS